MIESWRSVVGWTGYEVSDRGHVRSLPRTVTYRGRRGAPVSKRVPGVPLRWKNSRGYPAVSLREDGRIKTPYVHALVMAAFGPPRPAPGHEIRHRDGDKQRPWIENLEWGTHADNVRDSVRHGTHGMVARTRCPRGHLLVAPNLLGGAWNEGRHNGKRRRQCLCCERGRTLGRYHGWSKDRCWAHAHAAYVEMGIEVAA